MWVAISMTTENKDEIDIDDAAILARMKELSDIAGDWGDHLPYDVALNYFDNDVLKREYGPHIQECEYCRVLLDAMHPSNDMAVQFERDALNSTPPHLGLVPRLRTKLRVSGFFQAGFGAGLAAVLFFAVLPVGNILKLENQNETASSVERLALLRDVLQDSEQVHSPTQRSLHLARYNFVRGDQMAAYSRLADALAEAGVQEYLVDALDRPRIMEANTSMALFHLETLFDETQESIKNESNAPESYLRLAAAQSMVGQNASALAAIQRFMEVRDGNSEFLQIFIEMVQNLKSDLKYTNPAFGNEYDSALSELQ